MKDKEIRSGTLYLKLACMWTEEMIVEASSTPGTMPPWGHAHSSSEHLGSLAWCFLASVTLANTPASIMVRGEVIETSSGTVWPKNQLGSKILAWRDLLWSRVRLLPCPLPHGPPGCL